MGYESFVRTTKRIYSLDLILLSEEKQAQPAYVVQFRYPSEIAKKNAEEVRLAKEKQEKLRQKKLISESFEKPMRLKTGIISCESMKNMTVVVSPLILLMIMAYLPF